MNALSHMDSVIAGGLAWAPQWMIAVGVLVGSALVALVLYTLSLRLFVRLAHRFGTFPQTLVDYGRGPVATVLVIATLGAALPAAALSDETTAALGHLLLIGFVLAMVGVRSIRWNLGHAPICGASRSTSPTICWHANT